MNRMTKWATCLALTGTLFAAGCAPLQEYRGYKFEDAVMDRLQPGTTQRQVRDLLGSPSSISTVENKTWYYIFSRVETVTFFDPEEVERRVVAVDFDDEKKLTSVNEYGLEDGKIINFTNRTTPTRGKDLTILGEIFGNIGRFNKPTQPGR